MMPCFPVEKRASLIAASTASEPEFQKKNESSEGSGIVGSSRSISWRYVGWNMIEHCICTRLCTCAAAAADTAGWQLRASISILLLGGSGPAARKLTGPGW